MDFMDCPTMDCSTVDCGQLQLISTQSKTITDLPEEILLTIFSCLPKRSLAITAQVAKLFQRISYDASLWKIVCFKDEKLGPGTLGIVLSRGTKSLDLNNCKFSEPFFFEELGDCPLNHLTFTHCHGHLPGPFYQCLLWILRCCRQLTSLVLTMELVTLGDEFYRELAEERHLEVLQLWTDLKFSGVLQIARECQKLRSWIYFGREIKMTVPEIHLLIDHLAVSIETVYIFKFNGSMLDEHIAKLTKRCPNISHIHLQSCIQLTSESIDHLCTLKKLEYLNISRCCQISLNSLRQLQQVKSLKCLVAFDVLPSSAEAQMLQSILPNVTVDVFSLPMTNDDYDD